MGVGGTIFATIWPLHTRASAPDEHRQLVRWMTGWSKMAKMQNTLRYETPIFESIAEHASPDRHLAGSPRSGNLLKLIVDRLPPVPALPEPECLWLRYLFNDYQLALRVRRGVSDPVSIEHLPNTVGWYWPYVSRRAPGRSKIDVWSSRNEVAVADGIATIVHAVRNLVRQPSQLQFDALMRCAPQLSEWSIPRPPYQRTKEWSHQQ